MRSKEAAMHFAAHAYRVANVPPAHNFLAMHLPKVSIKLPMATLYAGTTSEIKRLPNLKMNHSRTTYGVNASLK